MTKMKIIQGGRRELEHQLLAAMFMPGGNASAETLKQRLAPRGMGRIRTVSAAPSPSPNEPPPTSEPVDD